METRRLLLAFALSMVVMLLWAKFFPRELPEAPAPAEQPAPAPPAPAAEGARPAAETGATAAPEAIAPPETEAIAPPPAEPIEAAAEERVVIETDLFTVELTNRGAQIVSFELPDHADAAGGRVNLVRRRKGWPYPFALTSPGGGFSPLNEALFAVERTASGGGGEEVVFRYNGAAGRAEKRFAFLPDGLFEVEVAVPGQTGWGVLLGPGIRNPAAEEVESRFARRQAVYRKGGEMERFDPTDDAEEVSGAGLAWAGIQDTYFLTALITGGVERLRLEPLLVEGEAGNGLVTFRELPAEADGDDEDLVREVQLVLQPSGDRLVGTAYWGPKEYDRLAAYSFGLESTVELGWFRIFSLPLLRGIQWIHDNLVANYGWAIILMTVVIRLLLFPLTHKSTVSMQKMQELNPKIQAIRQKYRSKLKDKQGRPNAEAQRKMNEEVMGLYRQEGVNPAGGCLPMLLQIPVLFAFYNLLSAAIELRHAPWILWVKDLSAPDPFYVLPIVMGASQFVQQRMTPAAGDPMQRRIFLLMPVFFTVLFLGFPAGLVLYWLTNNLLGIVQQAAYKRWRERKEAAAAAAAEKKPADKTEGGDSK